MLCMRRQPFLTIGPPTSERAQVQAGIDALAWPRQEGYN